jgi:hypothetical protein
MVGRVLAVVGLLVAPALIWLAISGQGRRQDALPPAAPRVPEPNPPMPELPRPAAAETGAPALSAPPDRPMTNPTSPEPVQKPVSVKPAQTLKPAPAVASKAELAPGAAAGIQEAPPPPDPEQVVRGTLHNAIAAFENCYENSLRRDSRIKGRILVALSVEANGRVASAKITESTIKDEPVMDCIASRLRQLKFPPLGEEVDLTVPMALVPRML